ncbi:hypothetical protein ACF1B0_21390 [Streptomyces anandii]|uniref:hypothetical protein n=1 Tax=Streptomyces anandii TaxID=285454 RepID=UPI0036FA103F
MVFRRAMALVAAVLVAVLGSAGVAQAADGPSLIPLPNQAQCLLVDPLSALDCLHL